MNISQKTKIELSFGAAILLLSLYLEKMKTLIWIDMCTPAFTEAKFTIAQTWKQPKCPSTDGWIKKVWYIYIIGYYSVIKKNKIMLCVATWIDLDIIILSKSNKYHMISFLCEIIKIFTNGLIYKTETDSQT